ncbi:hypothetical protein [Salinicola salarius]|uniref:hypothetical protein n=1 Tax=Salinicola salarius TaxID=430457 RepID=UPI000DA18B5E|nr:hypothetical protein [Salinicola salarius]
MIEHRRRLAAEACPLCHGHGSISGVFHRLHCEHCAGVGYLQTSNGQPVDLRAADLLRRPLRSAGAGHVETTPDTWSLIGNYRGD